MAVLFDSTDEYVRYILDRARARGAIILFELESIVEAAIETKGSLDTDDIADTIDALAAMGIDIDDGLTQEQKDAEFDRAMTDWVDKHGLLPSLTAEGWAMLARVMERKKAADCAPPEPNKPSAEEEAATVREALSKRTFIQNAFAHLGPRIRSERKELDAGASAAGDLDDSHLGDFTGDPAELHMLPSFDRDLRDSEIRMVGEEESHLGDFIDGPDGSPPEGIHFHYDFARIKRRAGMREQDRGASSGKEDGTRAAGSEAIDSRGLAKDELVPALHATHIGFTGTRGGMTTEQKRFLREMLRRYPGATFHHGDAVGADAEAHDIAVALGLAVVIHPPEQSDQRAFKSAADVRPPKAYLDRNKDIVRETELLIAAPAEATEELRSGTWSTVRYAWHLGRQVLVIAPSS